MRRPIFLKFSDVSEATGLANDRAGTERTASGPEARALTRPSALTLGPVLALPPRKHGEGRTAVLRWTNRPLSPDLSFPKGNGWVCALCPARVLINSNCAC